MKKYEWIGWYGVAAVLYAYYLISFDYVTSKSLIYQLLNLLGGIGLVIISLQKKAYPPAVSNTIWALIAGIAILNILIGTGN